MPTKTPEHLDSVIVHYRSLNGYFISAPMTEQPTLNHVQKYFDAPINAYLVNVHTNEKNESGNIPNGRYRLEIPIKTPDQAEYFFFMDVDRYPPYFPGSRVSGPSCYQGEIERRLIRSIPPILPQPKRSASKPIELTSWIKKSSEDTLENITSDSVTARIHLLLRIRGLWIKHTKLPKSFFTTGGNIIASVRECDDKSICVVCKEACLQNFLCEKHFDKGCINLWNKLKETLQQEDSDTENTVNSLQATLPTQFTKIHNILLTPKFRYVDFKSPKTIVNCSSLVQKTISSLCEYKKEPL
eukprot:TRINITY_DN795_c0_g1_i1.p1 TRINITY_DN795_c0_g1~~TRINITY_DN795_c0_g1_i1.p1  ORF type:complete len:299 (-),score=31.61 TRINITY_DN795_c0_g1_i1:89-985(-)